MLKLFSLNFIDKIFTKVESVLETSYDQPERNFSENLEIYIKKQSNKLPLLILSDNFKVIILIKIILSQ